MKLFVCDNLFDNSNISGYNSLLIDNILDTNKDDCIIVFIENVEKNYKIYDYLNEKNDFNHYFWCENLKELFEYNIIVTSIELFNDDIMFYDKNNTIYYFCEKKNIIFNEKFNNIEKYLFLSDYDTINDVDKTFFTKIYTFNNYFVDNNKVEFVRFNFNKNEIMKLFDNTTKEFTKLSLEIKEDYIIIFIQLFDSLFYDALDRIILSISELKKKYKIYTIIHWPLYKEIEKTITKKEIIFYNEKMYYKFYNIHIPIDIKNSEELIKNNDIETITIKFSINKEHSLTIKDYLLDIFNKYLNDEYTIITTMDDYNILKYVYLSDIYIPVTENLTYFSLLSQYYKTYTIFTNDSNNSQEYCIFGDIPLLNSSDYIHCSITNRIKKNLRVEDVKNSIENYIINKGNPFFLYKGEFCQFLFG
jgi:hypothetical protein